MAPIKQPKHVGSNLNNNKLINEKLICAFRWSVLPSIMKMRGPKNKTRNITETSSKSRYYLHYLHIFSNQSLYCPHITLTTRDISKRMFDNRRKYLTTVITQNSNMRNTTRQPRGAIPSQFNANEVEQWYVRHNYFYCLITWATCFDLYTGHLQAFFYR